VIEVQTPPALSDHNRWLPGAPRVISIRTIPERSGNKIIVGWERPPDKDNDIVDCRVLIGSKPRGWNYPRFDGPKDLIPLLT
jgi:hypothetical protein